MIHCASTRGLKLKNWQCQMLGKLQNDREFHLLPLKLQNDKVPLVKKKEKKRQFLIQLNMDQVKISNVYNEIYGKIFLVLDPANISCCLVFKLCLILLQPQDCSLPGSSLHGISQARVLEWVAVSFSRGSSWPRNQIHVSCTKPPGKPKTFLTRTQNEWTIKERIDKLCFK